LCRSAKSDSSVLTLIDFLLKAVLATASIPPRPDRP
jgi:hypothetical protein